MEGFCRGLKIALLAVFTATLATPALAADARLLDLGQRTQNVLDQVLAFERDLGVAEERYRPVPDNRVEVVLSLTTGSYFRLRHVDVQMDGQPLVSHDYTASELAALRKGGMHRIYAGNQPPGRHELAVSYRGVGSSRDQGSEHLSFQLGPAGRLLQISIDDRPIYPDEVPPAQDKDKKVERAVEMNLHAWTLTP